MMAAVAPDASQEAAPGRITSRAQWLADPAHEGLYVWLHVDANGDPFYAGRGRGAYAWEVNCGPAWEWYVRHRLGGAYEVSIQAHSLTDAQSEQLMDQMLATYADKLLNRVNFHRRYDTTAERDPGPDSSYYDRVREATDPDEQLRIALEAQQLQYRSGGPVGETGRFGEVLTAMGAAGPQVNNFFMPYIVEGLMVKREVEQAKAALGEFLEHAPNALQSSTIERLQKIVDRGTFKRRPRKSKDV